MPKARKLPSGSYRCLVFAGYEIKDGKKKRKYESFTASTKREAEAMAAKWADRKNQRPEDITVGEAIKRYIEAKENVLSPSTIRGYNTAEKRFDQISETKLRALTNADVQLWISELSTKVSAKTVRNTYGLLTSALSMFAPGLQLSVTLPQVQKKQVKFLTAEQLQKLLDHTKGKKLWIAIMLARYYGLRRSEICALRSEDLAGNILTIRRAMVPDKDGNWIIKERPKTDSSYRYLIIGEPLLSVLKECDGPIMDCNPDALFDRFRRALKALKLSSIPFHTLRHMFATGAAKQNIPDIYTAKMGGWNPGSSVLKKIYQNAQDDDLRKQMNKLNKVMQHEMQHGTPKKRKTPQNSGV